MSDPSRVKFTYDDFVLFPDDGKRHELIDGDHYVTPSPKTKHQRVSMKLSSALNVHADRSKAGEVFAAPTDVFFSPTDIAEPDVIFVSAPRAAIITEDNIQGAPDLVIEILSPSTRRTDEIVKRKLYERFGVPEYWIVDPELETVKIHRLESGRYVRAAELSLESNDTLETPLLPGFRLSLSDVFD